MPPPFVCVSTLCRCTRLGRRLPLPRQRLPPHPKRALPVLHPQDLHP